jgi:hypothetical protein
MSTISSIKCTVAGLMVVAAFVLATTCAASLGAAPSQSSVATVLASQTGMIDRSRKGDRLAPVAPAIKVVLLPGCEPQFSPLTRLSPSNFAARRCLT